MQMIKININSVKWHTEVALLVDKIPFLKHIFYLREKWEINQLFKPGEYQKFVAHIWGKDRDDFRWDEFINDIIKTRIRFNRTPNFDKVIIYAIGFSEIPKHAYKSSYLRTIQNSKDPDDIEYVIAVTPYTTEAEVKKELKSFKKIIKTGMELDKDKKRKITAVAEYKYDPGSKFNSYKGKPTIERIRQWYWVMFEDIIDNPKGKQKSYQDTLDDWQVKFCPQEGVHDVKSRDKCPFCKINDADLLYHLLHEYIEQVNDS